MIGLSWDNFDKAFWVSSTNMRNLINSAIRIDINVGGVEDKVGELHSIVDSITSGPLGIDAIWDEFTEVWNEFLSVYHILDEIMDLISGGGGGGGGGSPDPELAARVSVLEGKVSTQERQIADLTTVTTGLSDQLKRYMEAQQELNIQIAAEIVKLDERIKALGG